MHKERLLFVRQESVKTLFCCDIRALWDCDILTGFGGLKNEVVTIQLRKLYKIKIRRAYKLRSADFLSITHQIHDKIKGITQHLSEFRCVQNGSLSLIHKNISFNIKIQAWHICMSKLVDCLEKCLIYGHIRRFAD